jgi:hypothetical protein
MSKIGLHDPFEYLKHKLWPKEGLGVELAIWLPTTKNQPCVQVACHISLESSQWGLQLCRKPHLNQRSAHKVWVPKVARVPSLGISGLPLWTPRTKCHLDDGPMANHRVYYKGEGGGFPQVRAMVSLVSLNLPVAYPNTKSAQTMH